MRRENLLVRTSGEKSAVRRRSRGRAKMSMNIMIKIRHGGEFRFHPGVEYVGGTFHVEFCDAHDISIEHLKDMVEQYGYQNVSSLYYSIPSAGLKSGGLKTLISDLDLGEAIEVALRHRVIEIYANHGIDIPVEVDVPLQAAPEDVQPISEAQNTGVVSPKRVVPTRGRKKLTPKRRRDFVQGQGSGVTPTMPNPSPPPIPTNVNTSSDDDDSVEDETYKIDPTEALEDDDAEDPELVDEFNAENKRKKGKHIMKTADGNNQRKESEIDAGLEEATDRRVNKRGGSRTGRGRGRGRGMARGRSNDIRVPEGYGLWHGDHGEVAYIDPTANEATILHGSTQTSTQNASQVQTQASNTPTT